MQNDDDRGNGRRGRRSKSRRRAAKGFKFADDREMVAQTEKGLQTIMDPLQ